MDPIAAPSPNHGPRPAGQMVDMLVLHYTGMRDGPSALARLRDSAAQVSAHYLIEEDGRVFALVSEERRAWHAGLSWWRGRGDVNSRSIGIEIVNPGHAFGYRPFPEVQMAACEALCRAILARHPIPARHVVGHADVAPDRKEDPGELFDWPRLARAGVGVVPRLGACRPRLPPTRRTAAALLRWWGYPVTEAGFRPCLCAFQRHFRPRKADGDLDWQSFALLTTLCLNADQL